MTTKFIDIPAFINLIIIALWIEQNVQNTSKIYTFCNFLIDFCEY